MRLEWLEDILAIESTGSFNGAAERRRLTQSAFSRRIQQIELHIGVQLFDRSQKPVKLRQTTALQRAQIEKISTELRQLVVDLRRGDRMASNKIVLASQHSLTTSLAPIIVKRLQQEDETIYVRLRSANLDDCFGLLLSRQADIAIVYRLLDEGRDITEKFFETMLVGSDRLIPVGVRSLTTLFQVETGYVDIPYIDYPADVFFGKVMASKILPALDPTLNATPKVETALTFAALEMAVHGIAVAWVPESVARVHITNELIDDLSSHLPSCALQVRAVRLLDKHTPAEDALWSRLI